MTSVIIINTFNVGIQGGALRAPPAGLKVLKSQLIKTPPAYSSFVAPVVPFCVQLDLLSLPHWSSFDGNNKEQTLSKWWLLVLLLNSPSFSGGLQGHQPPHGPHSWIPQALFRSVALECSCSLFSECFSPFAPTLCPFVHTSKHELGRPECLI